ncbi:nucleic acid-binding protein [Streptomyces sp. P6-2-1]|uniref:nucleic acid-binding protein n=1 Tax=unclassified Streptomyces TaxID=2593676 RepID=UPI003D35C376
MLAWERPEGYWAGARTHPASPGWSVEEREEVAALRARERVLAAVIVTHEVGASLPAEERTRVRDALKHDHEAPAAEAAGARG